MADGREALLESGNDALKRADWRAAAEAFQAVDKDGESGEARFGLGIAQWWSGDVSTALRTWERAFLAFRQQEEAAQAVLTAVYLCLAYRMTFGNDAAAEGWLAKASTIVDEHHVAPMEGWVLLCRAYLANDGGRPEAAERSARESLAIAKGEKDADLELCATCELGAALLALDQSEEGAPLLDWAMASCLAGEAEVLDTVVLVSCRTITACSRVADIKRAVQWIRAADEFNRRYGSIHLHTTCRTHHGAVLFAVGDWSQAEVELEAALQCGAEAEPVLHAEAVAKLAELRLAKGQIEVAERILAPHAGEPVAAYARAAILLARGSPDAAASLARRRLHQLAHREPERAALLDLVAESEVELGQTDDLVGRLPGVVGLCQAGHSVVGAFSARALGRATAAIERVEASLAAFAELGMLYEASRTRLLLARLLAPTETETAIADARLALAAFESLGAERDADAAAALLRSLGAKASRSGPKGGGLLTKREGEILALLGEGLSNPAIATRLFISRKTVEHHVASVLSKLGLSGRAEAAAVATSWAERSSTGK
ncbi:MAG: LuxR C-terminal-related transcriptional regulator [Acidimicrobiales bacterium]